MIPVIAIKNATDAVMPNIASLTLLCARVVLVSPSSVSSWKDCDFNLC